LGTTDATEGDEDAAAGDEDEAAGDELVVPAAAELEVESVEVEEPEAGEAAAPWAFCEEVAAVLLPPPQPAQYINDANTNPKIIVRTIVLLIQPPRGLWNEQRVPGCILSRYPRLHLERLRLDA
jgi:hypothetical protein